MSNSFKDISLAELETHKKKLDEKIESLRRQILKDLDQMENLCKEGLTTFNEISSRKGTTAEK